MESSAGAVDEVIAGVVRGFEFQGDDEVLLWWRIMREAHDAANGDVEYLVTRVRAAALDASLDKRMLENFALATSAGGIDLVERMIALEPWMPAYCWTLRNCADEVQHVEAAREWDGVTAAQVQVLHDYWGEQWTTS
jgi:hypothetical protein